MFTRRMTDALSDIILLPSPRSGTQLDFLDDDRVFIDVFAGEDAKINIDKTSPPTLKIRRFGPLKFIQASTRFGWATSESYVMPPTVQSLSIIVSVDSPQYGNILVGGFEMDTNHLQDMSLHTDNTFFRGFATAGNSTRLGISLACIYIPRNEEHSSNGPLSHTEYESVLEGQKDGFYRARKIGDHFYHRFLRSRLQEDIDKAIRYYEHSARLTRSSDAENKTHCFNNLGMCFGLRFECSRDLTDIENAITSLEYALHLTPDDHADKPGCLNNLGNAFLKRSEHSKDLSGIDKAISYYEHAMRLTPDSHADKPKFLNNLGNSLLKHSENTGDLVRIDKAISHYEHAVLLTTDGHDSKPSFLKSLGNSFMGRFECSRDTADVGKAITHLEHAVRLTPIGHADKPGHLSSSFYVRFKQLGDLLDIEEAIAHYKHAVNLTPDAHTDKPSHLSNLGSSLLDHFKHTKNVKDIDEAISYQERAVHLAPDDIDKAITHHEHAVSLIPDGHANKPSFLNNLGTALLGRFEHSHDLEDIKKAISHQEHAVNLVPDSHADKPAYLNNLGNSFHRQFDHSRDPKSIENALSHHEHAVRLLPDGHADKPSHLSNLGTSFMACFKHSGDLMDMDRAIIHLEHALRLTADDHANKPGFLNNIGLSFMGHFEQSGDLVDIDKAISHQKDAVSLTPDGHAKKSTWLSNLGDSFSKRYKRTKDSSDLESAILSFKDCATASAGNPSIKFAAALMWARLSSFGSSSLTGYETAMSLLPRIAWLGQSVSTRWARLTPVGSIAMEAAAAAIASGRPDIALEWLEQGRSIVWNQLLNLRTPLDDLHRVDRDLAENLVSTSKSLENASLHGTNSKRAESHLSLEEAAQAHRRLAEKWDNLLNRVRTLPGFEDFLLPKKLPALTRAAESGPVVVINVHKSRSDALILLPGFDDVLHIPLGSNLYRRAQGLLILLNKELRGAGIGVRAARAGRPAPTKSGQHGFAKILANLWTDLVKPVLDGLAFNKSNVSNPPRIWWCPTGPLTFLPIHAAGIYGQSFHGPSLSDFAISSYTPTVTALLKTSSETSKKFNGFLGVSQSNTPGLSRLPNADKELELIKQLGSSLRIHSLQGWSATVERVFEQMEEASWVHFACHAIQNPSSPLNSAFCLENGHLTLSKIITKSFSNADFAFLSACETATGDKNLPEESVHLAAGMLAAGYRSVIATMWSIGDNDAPLIAGEVYSRLLVGRTAARPDSSMAAYALHHAVKRLREKLGTGGSSTFLSWVPYIHVGH